MRRCGRLTASEGSDDRTGRLEAALLISAIGVFFVGIGAWGVARPHAVLATIGRLDPRRRLALAVGVRVVLGLVFLWAGPFCRQPGVVVALGWVALAAAVLLLMLGSARLDAIVRYWLERPRGFLRAQFALVIAVGSFFVWTGL